MASAEGFIQVVCIWAGEDMSFFEPVETTDCKPDSDQLYE